MYSSEDLNLRLEAPSSTRRVRCYSLTAIRFDWDPQKARTNLAKHGVSFSEASTVFADVVGWTYPDSQHSNFEERWLTLGMSEKGRILVVAHTVAEEEQLLRIISAREATRKERQYYEERR